MTVHRHQPGQQHTLDRFNCIGQVIAIHEDSFLRGMSMQVQIQEHITLLLNTTLFALLICLHKKIHANVEALMWLLTEILLLDQLLLLICIEMTNLVLVMMMVVRSISVRIQ